MAERIRLMAAITLMGALVGGCALNSGDLSGSNTTTSSINTNTASPGAIAAVQPQPACVALKQRIDALKGESFVGNIEKAAAGQAKSVAVKREDLAKMAELQKSNDSYQKHCSPTVASSASTGSNPTATAKPN